MITMTFSGSEFWRLHILLSACVSWALAAFCIIAFIIIIHLDIRSIMNITLFS
jgi:hypothetical protein